MIYPSTFFLKKRVKHLIISSSEELQLEVELQWNGTKLKNKNLWKNNITPSHNKLYREVKLKKNVLCEK